MPYKDKDRRREYQREWARRRRAGEPTKGIRKRQVLSPEEAKRRARESSRKSRAKTIAKAEKIFGKQCKVCARTNRRLIYHEKYGNKHSTSGGSYYIALKNPDNFIRLCEQCHRGFHFLMDIGMTWDDICQFLKEKGINI